jgi:hypothetical protein
MSFSIRDFGVVGNYLLAVSDGAGASGWYITEIPNNLEQPTWIALDTPDTNGRLRVAGIMALQVTEDGSTFWVDALLCNSASVTDIDNFAVYIHPETKEPQVKVWTQHYPSDEDGTPDSMPYAGICTMWGDFLILGDIIWNADDSQPLTESNSSRYSHGLWFSEPGKTDRWEPINTVFVGQKAGGNVVQGLFPLEVGLLVVTCTLVASLRGSPSDFIYQELRQGISNCGRNGVAAWPNKGGVVWADRNDYVWFTNGEDFVRMDDPIRINDARSVACVGEYLFVSTEDDVHVYRMYTDNVYSIKEEYSSGWTRMNVPFGYAKMLANQRFLFGIEARDDAGSFILDDEIYGLLDDENNLLWGADRVLTVFDLLSDDRGKFNNRPIISTIRTRPLPGAGHSLSFWHRFGVRASGSGRVRSVTSRPSADPAERGLVTRSSLKLADRKDYVFDAHGPSLEATFDFEFDGDVTVEHVTVWSHRGATTR